MYELRTLGTLDVRGSDGASLGPLLAQPKRAALLAYVAVARPYGPVRRDILLATFWPEMPDDRARAALRNALSFIRRAAPGILLPRADDGVEVAGPDVLRCDVRRMEAALAAGDVAGALAHYGGDLLAGVHVDDAPAWEHWRDAERLRLRHLALAAAAEGCDAARRRGDLDAAVGLARRACEIDPDDEPAVRRLMQMLAGRGDPAGALREYDRFAARLMREMELTPSAETDALRRTLRIRADPPASPHHPPSSAHGPAAPIRIDREGDGDGTIARSADPHPPIDPPAVPPAPLMDAQPLPSILRGGRRGLWMAALAVLVVAVAAIVIPRFWGGAGDADGTVATRVAVLPFAVRGGQAHTYLSEGMADLLSTRLDGTGELTTVDPFALLSFLRSSGDDETGLDAGRAAARRFGAGRFILGTVVSAGGRLHLNAAVYGADGHRRAHAEVADLREDSLFAAVDALVRTLVAEGMETAPEQLDRTAALTTGSLPALKAYLAGGQAFRAGDFNRAAEQFDRAVQADTAFALASYRLSVALDWAAQDGSAAAARALRLSDRLSPAEQRLLSARVAFRTGSALAAERELRDLVSTRPDNVEAWNDLGEVLHHRAMWQGRALVTARPAWEQVVALDPANVNARAHLVHIAALQGRTKELQTLLDDVARLSPAHESLTRIRALRAFALRDGDAQARVLATLRAQAAAPRGPTDVPAWSAAWRTADFLVDPEAGYRIAGLMGEPGRDDGSRLLGHTTRAHMQMARGRWRDARAHADSAARIDPAYAARTWAFLVGFFPGALPRDEAVRALGMLAATSIPAPVEGGGVLNEERRHFPGPRHHYLLGTLAVRVGNAAEAERKVAALTALEDTTKNGRFARHVRHQLQARIRAAAGDPAGALNLVEAGWPEPVPALFVKDDSYSTVAERWFRAELLARVGRRDEALAWYGSMAEDISRGLVFHVRADLEQARLLERGRRGGATPLFARFADRWRTADPENAGLVRYARERG